MDRAGSLFGWRLGITDALHPLWRLRRGPLGSEPVISLDEAIGHVLDRCEPLDPRSVPLDLAAGCVAAEPFVAAEAVPPFANSAMDGYAVRAGDVAEAAPGRPVRLRVVATVLAGQAADVPVVEGTAVRIMTGAPVPGGADAVVMVERSTVDGDHVWLDDPVAAGRNVRPAGDDIDPGQPVVSAGTVLTPAHLGVLASVGVRAPLVVPRPSVGVLSTGDELVDSERELRPGEIRESNRPTLVAALRSFGIDATDLGTVPDDADRIRGAVVEAAGRFDAVVTSGGVSMGDVDLVKVVMAEIADMRWMQVAIRPAKPFAFGVREGTPIFGLPGNPVSSLVSLSVLALPGLRAMAARSDLHLPRVPARLAGPVEVHGDRTAFVRVSVHWDGSAFEARPVGAQGSHQLAATAGANGLAVIEGGTSLAVGDDVSVALLRDPFGP